MKRCPKCGLHLQRFEFHLHPSKRDGLSTYCRKCIKVQRHAHPERNKARYRCQNLKRRFGITVEQYETLLAIQGGKCALFEVCGSTEPGGKGRWHIDHDHITGRIRGLLCYKCNAYRVGVNNSLSAEVLVRYFKRENDPLPSVRVKSSGRLR